MQHADILTTKQNSLCRSVFGEDALWAPEAGDTGVNISYISSIGDSTTLQSPWFSYLRVASTGEQSGYLYVDPVTMGNRKYTIIDISGIDFMDVDTSNCVYDASTGSRVTSSTDLSTINPLIKIRIRMGISTIDQRFYIYDGGHASGLEHFDDAIFQIETSTNGTLGTKCAYVMKGGVFDIHYNGTVGIITVVKPYTLRTKKMKRTAQKVYRCNLLECDTPAKSGFIQRFMEGQKVFFSDTSTSSYSASTGAFTYGASSAKHYAMFQAFSQNPGSTPYVNMLDSSAASVPIDPSHHVYGDDYYLGSSSNSASVMVPPTIMANIVYEVEGIFQQRNRTLTIGYDIKDFTYYLKPGVMICQNS